MPGGSIACSYLHRLFRQPILKYQIFKVFLIKDLNIDIRVYFPQAPHFSIFLRDERLLHGGQFHIEIEFRKVKIRSKRFEHAALVIKLNGKAARLIFPRDPVKIQQGGEYLLRSDARTFSAATGPSRAATMPCSERRSRI